jgi:hypothetical protein
LLEVRRNNQTFFKLVHHGKWVSRCHVCTDSRYWHCVDCNICSYGMSVGRCENCNVGGGVGGGGGDTGNGEATPTMGGRHVDSVASISDLMGSEDDLDRFDEVGQFEASNGCG